VAEDVSDDQFFYEAGLKQILESVLGGNFLCLADVIDDLPDVVH
jgi:hypothetical protein